MTAAVNIADFEDVARQRLSKPVFDFIAGGAEDERTVAANRHAFGEQWLLPRVLAGVADRDLSCTLLGAPLPFPIILAPTSSHALVHPDGEAETVRGAADAGALMTLSGGSSVSLERVAAAGGAKARLWLHLYCHPNRALTESIVERAEQAGYRAFVITADAPVLGRRERDLRNGFSVWDLPLGNYPDQPTAGSSAVAQSGAASFFLDPAFNWSHAARLRSRTTLPLIVKGILRPDDARRALESGADAVWVSNHGGRQLDGVVPTLRALGAIADAVGGKTAIILDGGIRRGTDVLKALALGATAVAIGRPQLWGLAADGAEGVRRVLWMLRDELSIAMALTGCKRLADIDSSLVELHDREGSWST